MSTIAQKPRPPITNGCALRGLSRNTVFAVQHRERTASNPKREVPIADQLTRERGDCSRMTDKQDPFVHPGKAPLYLGNKDGQKSGEAVVQGNHVFAFAGRIPHWGPRIVDLREVDLQGACG
jgi:hypothetical protein